MPRDMWKAVRASEKPVVLYGTGNAAEKIAAICLDKGIEIAGVFASDGFVRDRSFLAHKVMSYSQAKQKYGEMLVLLCFGSDRPDVLGTIKCIASEQEFYAPDLPIAGGGLFDEEYFNTHIKDIERIKGLLADEQSIKVLNDVVDYKISGDISHLLNCESPEDDAWKLLDLKPGEKYLDLGAYTGDTVQKFLDFCPDYAKIYAVEPEDRNFRKLSESVEGLNNCEIFKLGISDKKEEKLFAHGTGRGASKGNGRPTPFDRVDSILNGRGVSLIKMDLEGEEPKAIDGAVNTIKNCRPKLLISAYHRIDDLWSLADKVLAIRNDYKIYLRHSPCLPAWEINYIFK